MKQYSKYPKTPDLKRLSNSIMEYSQFKHELGSVGIDKILKEAEINLEEAIKKIKALPIDEKIKSNEPDNLKSIKVLRPNGPRRIWTNIEDDIYKEKLEGALYARIAGCILGSIVEFWTIEEMKKWAEYLGDAFPPIGYWSKAKDPYERRYQLSMRSLYTKEGMNGVPVDDDIIYTLLGLLMVEEYGNDFTVYDTAKAWKRYLPYACTAEAIALANLEKSISPDKVGDVENPCNQWIGADIRSDPFAYMAPGFPEKAAEMAYNDAYISHRRNGIYGEMFFAAAQSAAFTVDNAVDALEIGLSEIPKNCALAGEVRWALAVGGDIKNYQQARDTVDFRYKGMNKVHTINNAVLTIWGLMIGGNDVTKVISETVAMGLDNDCTAATAGSIVGAIVGKSGVSTYWYENFNNKIYSYLNEHEEFKIDDLIKRFAKQAKIVHSSSLWL